MKKWLLALTLAGGVIALSACNQNGSGSDLVAESKAGNVTKDELYQAMKVKYGEQTLQEVLNEKVLSKKYKVTDAEVNKKVDEIKAQAGANFQMLLMQNNIKDEASLKKILKNQLLIEKAALKDVKVTDAELKQAYDNIKPEIKARHILVKDEKTALDVKKQLDAGAKFEDLAKKYSQDPGSAKNGGDLGWFGPGKMLPEFENAAYALKINEISAPVKSQYGYHIIQLTGKKAKKSFDQMKGDLETQVKSSKLNGDLVNKTIAQELKAADVKIDDKDLKDTLKQNAVPTNPNPNQ
ncbi:MAG: peptidylprolyl isomerase [Bacillota bacterium]|nr:peptidylprolyl isomerase [Bacillota bacterium]MDP4169183.1 peptidylprolyl isomerase [Bacillota bacterium]